MAESLADPEDRMQECMDCGNRFDTETSGYGDTSKCGRCWDRINQAEDAPKTYTVRRCVLHPMKRVLRDGVYSWDYPKKHSHAGKDIGCRPGFILLCEGETYKEKRTRK